IVHRGGGEAAGAVAEEHGEVVRGVVGDDQVGVAVAVHQAGAYPDGLGADGVGGGGLEGAVAVAERDGDVAAAAEELVGGGEVELAVGVEVGERDGDHAGGGGVHGGVGERGEGAIAVAVQDGDGGAGAVGAEVGDGEVEHAVAVEVAGLELLGDLVGA